MALSWLDEKDRKEWQWAAGYLSSRCSSSMQDKLSILADTDFSYLVRSIHALESEAEGVKLIARLRNAIRQRRYRLSNGGRKTCSFTLPSATKATLKTLAKRYKTTETGLIERLIERASRQASIQREEARHESQAMKAIRNARKLEQELAKVRIEETGKQLRHCLKQLALWEVLMGDELRGPNAIEEAKATALTEQRLRVIQEAIDAAVAKHATLSPRSI
ncbi:hypothetical protein SAMN03097710_101162 [Pseudomonas aeruginosa]|uniref:hypothetical protein n=1 Tax=Pseudomonas aeruginosa TaxID=287 RepID=UPI0009CDE8D3|nr:hypothetical protein [Pseudomonas aeruginosa]SKB27511.1 hypothetical protein SAMN03097710_101162 [Pseudomonas aeruginosa]